MVAPQKEAILLVVSPFRRTSTETVRELLHQLIEPVMCACSEQILHVSARENFWHVRKLVASTTRKCDREWLLGRKSSFEFFQCGSEHAH